MADRLNYLSLLLRYHMPNGTGPWALMIIFQSSLAQLSASLGALTDVDPFTYPALAGMQMGSLRGRPRRGRLPSELDSENRF